MIKVCPSLLNVDESRFLDIFNILHSHPCFSRVHLDVMDGKYVLNTSFCSSTLKYIKELTNKDVDVHLMTYDLIKHINDYCKYNPSSIIIHKDAIENNKLEDLISLIKSKKVRVGLAIKPSEDIEEYKEYLKDIDIVLVMSVEPGKGGQEFIEESIFKIGYLDKLRSQNDYKYSIMVDGGINELIALDCIDEGADYFVVGSYLFKNDLDNTLKKFD